jgi:hypothetical protein
MKKLIIAAAIAGIAVPFIAAPVVAQDGAPELSKVDWYRVQMIKWKPGKAGRAHEIIEMFEKVDAELGRTGVVDLHMATGEWDSIVAMPMPKGIAAMGWSSDPEEKKWEEAFSRQVGGDEKAKALWEELDSLISERQRHIGHIDRD